MAVEWTDRTIRGPAADYMTREEFRKLFGMSEDLLDEHLQAGTIPPPAKLNARTVLFSWKHAVLLSIKMDLGVLSETPKGKG